MQGSVTNIMLKLINIKRNDNIITANYIPETSDEMGYIKLDLSNGKVIECQDTSYDIVFQGYLMKAIGLLKDIANKEPYEKEYVHIWY